MGNVSVWMWVGFFALVLAMLAVDLGVSRRRTGAMSLRTAALWSAVWIGMALLFNLAIYLWRGPEPALEFLTAYLIEKALSVDNLFVFVVIFSTFGVPAALPAPGPLLGCARRADHARHLHLRGRSAAASL